MALLAQLVEGVVATRFEINPDINKGKLTIGRHPSNDIQIDEDAVSSRHAVISAVTNSDFNEYKEYYLEDLGSTNGTFVNDSKVSKKARLHHNDVVRLAWNKFKFINEQEGDMGKTVHMLSDD